MILKKLLLAIAICALLLSACDAENGGTESDTTVDDSTEITESITDDFKADEGSSEKTAAPVITGKAVCTKGCWCVAGSCEEGSVITVSSGKSDTFTVNPQGTRFFFPFTVERNSSDKLTITAEVEGKGQSDEVSLTLEYEKGSCDVRVGLNSWLHYPATEGDFCGSNLLSDDELAKLENALLKRLSNIQKRTGKETKLILMICPNNATIYPENAPEEWIKKKVSDNSRRKQVIELVNGMDNDCIIAIDCGDYITEHKNLGHLYYQTDTHWNTLGAYFGYVKLMEAVAVDFPSAAPLSLDNFSIDTVYRGGGDLVSFLGIGSENGSEITNECTLAIESAVSFYDSCTDGTDDCITTKVDNSSLPTCVVQRDSFGTALHDFLAQHFSTMIYTPFGADQSVAMKYCQTLQPDYYIRIMVERDLYSKCVN